MKKLSITLSLFLFAVMSLVAQEAKVVSSSGAEITFEEDVIDYGTITENADGVRTFKFKNTGNEPLIISNAKGSCGCTVPTWPKKPINPGESGEIEVKYATSRIGPINKSITITSNATESNKVLRIKGMVTKKETTPVKKENSMAPTAN